MINQRLIHYDNTLNFAAFINLTVRCGECECVQYTLCAFDVRLIYERDWQ